jgi:hypothetical protein
MKEFNAEVHMVNMALAKMMQTSQTWHAVFTVAEAALNAHRIADRIRKDHTRMMQQEGEPANGGNNEN